MPPHDKAAVAKPEIGESVAALRMRDVATSPEVREAAEIALSSCRERIRTVLIQYGGSIEATARELNTSPRTLYRIISGRNLNLAESARRLQSSSDD